MQPIALFRFVFRTSQRAGEHLSRTGFGVVSLAAFAAAFGLDTASNSAHMLFALCCALLLVDFVASWRLDADLEIRRELPRFMTAGTTARYTLVVRNSGPRRLTGLSLHERLRQPFPEAGDFARRHEATGRNGSIAGNRFDRAVGYPDWIDWLRRLRCLDLPPIELPPLEPGQSVTLPIAATPIHRGVAVFESPRLVRPGPLGLCLARRILRADAIRPAAQTLAVLPAPIALELAKPPGRRRLHAGGLALAMHVGDSEEFRSLRDYRPGDPLRAIHWRSWARTGKPVVREFHDEFFARHALVLDTAAAAPFDPALETAVALAAALVCQPRESDSLLDLLFVAGQATSGPAQAHRLTSGRGLGQTDSLLRVLAGLRPTPDAGFAALSDRVAAGAAQLDSLVCIFLSWDEARQAMVRRLQALGLAPIVWIVAPDPGSEPPSSRAAGSQPRWIDPFLAARGATT